jgi:hypothetical protein
MDLVTRRQLEARLYEEVETMLTAGDQAYLQSLSRHDLGAAIENELRFLGLYAYEDWDTRMTLHKLVEQHLDQWLDAYLVRPAWHSATA